MPKISVIIPVYKAEPYIERCVRSLFSQTLDDLEYIFIDDCTPDNSISVLKAVLDEYPNRRDQVKIVNHQHNQGVSQSRQDGFDATTGEYVIHCDPDDWIEPEMYELLYDKQKVGTSILWGATFGRNLITNQLPNYKNSVSLPRIYLLLSWMEIYIHHFGAGSSDVSLL